MVVVLNATLAGGVAIGASADLINYPFAAMCIGLSAGFVSSLGYLYTQGWLRANLKLHDTRGVQFSHGIPGILGGFASAISCAFAKDNFMTNYDTFFFSDAENGVRETSI